MSKYSRKQRSMVKYAQQRWMRDMFRSSNLTLGQLKKACMQYPYLALRYNFTGQVIGVNSKIAELQSKKGLSDNMESPFGSYNPISFDQYISIKAPFTN